MLMQLHGDLVLDLVHLEQVVVPERETLGFPTLDPLIFFDAL